MKIKFLHLCFLAVLLSACAAGNMPASSTTSEPTVAPVVETKANTTPDTGFTLTSPDLPPDGRLPVEYTCDGDGSTLALNWSSAPSETTGYAVIMHHVAAPDDVHWYWVLYNIPANMTSLPKNTSGVGTLGNNINNGLVEYSPPCSQGPGDKEYIYTVYALSAEPKIAVPAEMVDRATLLAAIKDITIASAELRVVYARTGMTEANSRPPVQGSSQQEGGTPPAEAIAACSGLTEQTSCSFADQNGTHTGVCETIQNQMACSPKDLPAKSDNNGGQKNGNQPDINDNYYNIDQAISDKAQGMTIAFDALAFMTGDIGSASFFPPGKVADFWGFQYLRDNDLSQMGHAGDFLTSAAMNMLNILTVDQRAQLVALAKDQVSSINEYGYKRFALIKAFQRLMDGDLPEGTTGLDEDAVKKYSGELYQLDGEISFERAQLMGSLTSSMDTSQLARLDAMKGKGMLEWPDLEEPADIQGLDRDVKVAVMTYAADMLSWYLGSVDADVYFCPERHGTYFGSFYLKDIKAMSDPSYAIPTNMTGDLGDEMLSTLDSDQAQLITGLVDVQKASLQGIVETRRQVSIELRKFLAGETADKATVLSLMEQYGELDGEIIYNLAVNFTKVSQSLTDDQKATLDGMREKLLGELSHPTGAYLYSQAIPMPEIPNTDFLFK